ALEKVTFETREQPRTSSFLKLFVPRLGVPTALVFRLLDQAKVGISLNRNVPAMVEFEIILRPSLGRRRNRTRPGGGVPRKPGRFQGAARHLARHEYLERAFA